MGYDSVADENKLFLKSGINNLQILIAEKDKIVTVIKYSIQSCHLHAFSDIKGSLFLERRKTISPNGLLSSLLHPTPNWQHNVSFHCISLGQGLEYLPGVLTGEILPESLLIHKYPSEITCEAKHTFLKYIALSAKFPQM